MLFDVHTHVQFAGFKDDWKKVIDRSLEEEVYLMNVGTQAKTSAEAVKIANMYEKGVYASVGLHPIHVTASFHDKNELGGGEAAKEFYSRGEEFDFAYYEKLASDPRVLAIGECGLDYYRLDSLDDRQQRIDTKKKQEEAFRLQADLAKKLDKALMLHVRPSGKSDDAYEDIYEILREDAYKDLRKILHFYVGSKDMTKKFIAAGYSFSLGGVNTFSDDYHESIKAMPMDRVLLETDAPYVAPEPYRGKRNEPMYIKETAKVLAEIKGLSYDKFSEQTIENTKNILKIDF